MPVATVCHQLCSGGVGAGSSLVCLEGIKGVVAGPTEVIGVERMQRRRRPRGCRSERWETAVGGMSGGVGEKRG